MIYLKTYNEKLGDKIKAPTYNEIIYKLFNSGYKPDYILKQCMLNGYIDGVKKILDEHFSYDIGGVLQDYIFSITNIDIIKYILSKKKLYLKEKVFTKDDIYYIEKYKLGLHQNKILKEEKLFIELLNNDIRIDNDENVILGYYNVNVLFNINKLDKILILFNSTVRIIFYKYSFKNLTSEIMALIIENYLKNNFHIDVKNIEIKIFL